MRTMSTTCSVKKIQSRCQRGISLIEALIAVLLLAVLFAGITFVLSRGMVSQRYSATQSLAIMEMRNALQQEDNGISEVCSGASTVSLGSWADSENISSSCNSREITINIPGFERMVTVQTISSFETTSNSTTQDLFGDDGIIRIEIE